jgi:hypothetical protein
MRIPVASGRAQAVKKCPKAEVTSNFDHLRALRKKAVRIDVVQASFHPEIASVTPVRARHAVTIMRDSSWRT